MIWMMALACSGGDEDDGKTTAPADDGDADTDADSDTDSDTDADTDSDADVDTAPSGDSGTSALSLVGNVYLFDQTLLNITQPAGIGGLLLGQFEPLLLEVTAQDPKTLELLGAFSDGTGNQDLCIETLALPPVDFTGAPTFDVGPVTLPVDVDGLLVTLEDAEMEGTFNPAGDALGQVLVSASIDTRPLVDLVAPGGGDSAVCDLVAVFGVACTPCPPKGGLYCLDYAAEAESRLTVGSLVPRTAADIAVDPACN